MKPIRILATLHIAVSLAVSLGAKPSLGLRSDFGLAVSSDLNHSTTPTGGFAVTCDLSQEGQDEISLGLWFAKLDYGSPWLSLSSYQDRLKGREGTLLSGYRRYFQPNDAKFRLFCGLDAGIARYSGNAKSIRPLTGGGSSESESNFTRWRPAVGGSLGCEYNFTHHYSLQLAYRYLIVSELGDFTAGASSGSFHVGQDRTHTLLLSLDCRF